MPANKDLSVKIKVSFVLICLFAVWLSVALVRVENQRYAMQIGMCKDESLGIGFSQSCLRKVETREGWWWHMFYALTD